MTREPYGFRRWAAVILLVVLVCGVLSVCLARSTKDCVWPTSGKKTSKDGSLTVDYSNASQGYIMVKASKSKKKLKIRIKKGDDTYNYDLNGNGEQEVFPLQFGSGSYSVMLYENKSGKQYALKGKVNVSVKLSDENAAFLCPSQYVWYTSSSAAVKKSFELCKSLKTDAEKLEAIRSFMKKTFTYDYIRAVTQKTSYLGDVDGVFSGKKGLCLDFACIMACMLRVQGIPTKLAIGQVTSNLGNVSHAWNYVLIDGEFVRVDITADISNSKNSNYSLERIY